MAWKVHLEQMNILAPEMKGLLVLRYRILRSIYYLQPLGRRLLSRHLPETERILRKELDLLKKQGLLKTGAGGMVLTSAGEDLVLNLGSFLRTLLGINVLEDKLKDFLQVQNVIVVPGDMEKEHAVRLEVGRAAAQALCSSLRDNTILAVSGGTTCAAVADMIPFNSTFKDLVVVPARGGLGEEIHYQANFIAARIAEKLNCSYRLLHLPDTLAEETLQALLKEPKNQEVLKVINSAQFLVHGIGTAREMAMRRGADKEEMEQLQEKGAVGEVFGVFFNSKGEVVGRVPSLGLYLDNLNTTLENIIVVAGGKKKAEAVAAILRNHPRDLLVTDEGAAREIIRRMGRDKETTSCKY